jgi:dienelactone hydrolase
LWSPTDAPGLRPLVVYSHGFMSTRDGGTHLAEHLTSHGYVVVAASFPLTTFGAPGGPNVNDVINQPRDVSFLIDRVLALGPAERAFPGGIDRDRIGVVGLSLGALTTTLVAYHPRLRDPRIRAAISIAGPSVMFGPRYFDFADVPFLMIAGTHDSMIPYEENTEPIPDKITRGGVITLSGASHAGFSYMAEGPMRLLGNPDNLGCRSLMTNLDLEVAENPFPELGGPEEGILDASESTLPCEYRFESAMSAGRQHWLTNLAARAFFESHFAADARTRADHALFLAHTLSEELAEVHYMPARRSS